MSRISQRLANRRAEPLQKLIVFRIREEWFAVLIQFAQKVVPLGLVYGAPQGGISLTRYQDQEIPVIDIERRVFGDASVAILSGASGIALPLPGVAAMIGNDQRHLMIVESVHGVIGIPMGSPPLLRRVPKSAFSPVPAIYLEKGSIQCVSALIAVSEQEPPFFLLNLDLLLDYPVLNHEKNSGSYLEEGISKPKEIAP